MADKQVAVAILNYNGEEHLQRFLPSVLAYSQQAHVYVIDNQSNDGSIAFLHTLGPAITIIQNQSNLGFCGGYEQGLAHITEPIWVLLNSDVEVSEGWLQPLLAELANSEVAACQPKILSFAHRNTFEFAGAAGGFVDSLGFPYCRGRLIDFLEPDQGQYNTPIDVFWATGACLAIKADAYRQVGGLDITFFAHMEEIDLCWRLQRAGYRIRCQPASTVYHLGGGTLQQQSPFKTYLNHRNNLLMLYKNLQSNRLAIIFFRIVLDGAIGATYLFTKGPRHTWAVVKAHFSFYYKVAKGDVKRTRQGKNKVALRPASLLFEYYVRGKRRFSELN